MYAGCIHAEIAADEGNNNVEDSPSNSEKPHFKVSKYMTHDMQIVVQTDATIQDDAFGVVSTW
jgi:hypothetical protein